MDGQEADALADNCGLMLCITVEVTLPASDPDTDAVLLLVTDTLGDE